MGRMLGTVAGSTQKESPSEVALWTESKCRINDPPGDVLWSLNGHQSLSRFLLDVAYVPGQQQGNPDTLSRWSDPAYLHPPETNTVLQRTMQIGQGLKAVGLACEFSGGQTGPCCPILVLHRPPSPW
eukprot:CAMPEP_0174385244 /NCGR_PEP_ID=MMETSP0811_2-20130205/126467_1 /TAXON_ID=73025 ORGANISM="Eutreptiella gymnastica-like, Strain CCMP1594" /NCGR_SAMPLE_ID=MMETSP0811_2 /ASSEMBLY_ACC=CAM_ASM_000667 /LENGTH=126 /DNA_ID=CAMNT_0015539489 /DNA_START=601 /DNA_END=978 /DNA_ORIENTATION=-